MVHHLVREDHDFEARRGFINAYTIVFEMGSLYYVVMDVLGLNYIDQAGLKLIESCLPLPPE